MRARPRVWIGLALSALCIYAVAREVDTDQVLSALAGVNYLWLIPGVLASPVTVWAKAARWRLLFVPRAGLRVTKLFGILMIGFLINSVLPARLGDPARAVLAGQIEKVKPAHALSTIVAERLLDVVTLLVLLVVMVPFVSLPVWMAQSAYLAGAGVVIGFAALLALAHVRTRIMPAMDRAAARLPRIPPGWAGRQAGYLLSGLDAFRSRSDALMIASWSLLVWLLAAAQNYFVLLAFDSPAPAVAAVLVLVVNALGMLVPSSPGYVGVFHYLTVVSLAIFGVDQNTALSYALILHLVTFLPLVTWGAVAMWRESLTFGRVSTGAAEM